MLFPLTSKHNIVDRYKKCIKSLFLRIFIFVGNNFSLLKFLLSHMRFCWEYIKSLLSHTRF